MPRAKVKRPGPVPVDALDYFRAKKLKPSFDYRDVWREEHAHAFTVAKAMQADVLTDIRGALDDAIANGTTLAQFKKDLTPQLQKLGWWGRKFMTDPVTGERREVQLGSPRRLRTIYRANLRTARAAGQWQRIERRRDTHPYLLYQLGPSENHRDQHVAWSGLLLPVDHGFWGSHMPPNGWGCKCWVRQVSKREAERLREDGMPDPTAPQERDPQTGLPTGRKTRRMVPVKTDAPKIRTRRWQNKRTGEIELVPDGIDPGWDTNPGKLRAASLQREAIQSFNTASAPVARDAVRELVDTPALEQFLDKPQGLFPVGVLDDNLVKPLGAKTHTVTLSASELPELAAAEIRRLPQGIASGAVIRHGGQDLVFFQDGETLYKAALKVSQDAFDVTLVSLATATRRELDRARRQGEVLRDVED